MIHVHHMSDLRTSGILEMNFNKFKQLFGDTTLKNLIILTHSPRTTNKDVNIDIDSARQRLLRGSNMFFKPALTQGAQIRHHDNSLSSAHGILRCIIENHPADIPTMRRHMRVWEGLRPKLAEATEVKKKERCELDGQLEKLQEELQSLM